MVIVNGYLCMNCCDIDKARLGQDPHQATNQLQKELQRHLDQIAGDFGPAVNLGGALAKSPGRTPAAVAASSAAATPASAPPVATLDVSA